MRIFLHFSVASRRSGTLQRGEIGGLVPIKYSCSNTSLCSASDRAARFVSVRLALLPEPRARWQSEERYLFLRLIEVGQASLHCRERFGGWRRDANSMSGHYQIPSCPTSVIHPAKLDAAIPVDATSTSRKMWV